LKVLILAAGQGTRLAPLTDERPKCLVELDGISLLDRQVAALKTAGLDDITVIGGYRGDLIRARGFDTIFNEHFASSNMVATLFSGRSLMAGDQDIMVSYGDIVYESSVAKALQKCSAPVCVVVDTQWRRYWAARMNNPLTDAETLKLSPEGRILELGKKTQDEKDIEGQYIGLIKIRADQVRSMLQFYDEMDRQAIYDGKDFNNMYMTSFLQNMIDNNWHVQSVPVENGWLEIDTLADLELYEWLHKNGELRNFYNLSPTKGT
jgi:choline kinase